MFLMLLTVSQLMPVDRPRAIPTLTTMMGTGYLEQVVPHLVKNLVISYSRMAPHFCIRVSSGSSASGGGVGEPRTSLYKLSSSDLAETRRLMNVPARL